MDDDRKWTPVLLAINEAIVAMGSFQKPLDPSLIDLTFGEWQLERARRILAAVEAALPELRKVED